jgi:hypothetical protein
MLGGDPPLYAASLPATRIVTKIPLSRAAGNSLGGIRANGVSDSGGYLFLTRESRGSAMRAGRGGTSSVDRRCPNTCFVREGLMAEVSIVERRGSHVLLQRRGRLAVVERRNGQIFAVGSEEREGYPDTPQGMAQAVGHGWGDPGSVRATFEELVEQEEEVAQRAR